MKKLLFLVSVLFSLTAAAQVKCTISGVVHDESLNGTNVYILSQSGVDTAVVADKAFAMNIDVEKPQIAQLKYGNKRQVRVLLYDGAKIDVRTGIRTHIIDNSYNSKYNAMIDSISNITGNARREMKELATDDEKKAFVEAKNREIEQIYFDVIAENKDNILGAAAFAIICTTFKTVEDFDAAAQGIVCLENVPEVAAHRANLAATIATQPGQMFVDFDGKNIDGTPAKLSDYVGKGKYVLVDFWASWCGPCRGEIPNLVELQNRFGGDKFVVLGVNVWDRKAAFEKALADEGINYPQLYASDNQEATMRYGIMGIPQIILFAPDGTIVQRDLRGDAMKQLVEKCLSK